MDQLSVQERLKQLSPQEYFETLLEILKQPVYREFSTSTSLSRLIEFTGQRDKFPDILEPIAPTTIKIMESGIFHKGGLKGAPLVLGGGDYESFYIKEVGPFVFKLAFLIDWSLRFADSAHMEEQVKKGFDDIQSRLSGLVYLVRRVKGPGKGKQLERAVQRLKDLEQKTMAIKTKPRPKPYEIKKAVARLFLKSVEGPKDLLMERAAELLNQFDISATPEGMREILKKK